MTSGVVIRKRAQFSGIVRICRNCLNPIEGAYRRFDDEDGTTYECLGRCESPVLVSDEGLSLPPMRTIRELAASRRSIRFEHVGEVRI